MARIVRFDQIGGPENLKIVEEAPAEPGAGEVRVDVKAAGLNRAEYLFLQGQYLEQPEPPSRIGVEGSGVISAVGPGVSNYAGSAIDLGLAAPDQGVDFRAFLEPFEEIVDLLLPTRLRQIPDADHKA